MDSKKRFALVIFSHSSYTDVWPILIESYAKHLDCDLFDYFITSDDPGDATRLEGSRFQLITYDRELAWTDAFAQSVGALDYERFLFSYDDLILRRPVDTRRLGEMLEFDKFDYLKVICSHVRFYDRVFRRGTVFEVNPTDSYRGSLVFSILGRSLLEHIIRDDEMKGLSAWQYERRINSVLTETFRYACVRQNLIKFENLIIKGEVNPLSRVKLKKLYHLTYSGDRLDMSASETLVYHTKLAAFTIIKYFSPAGWFARMRRLKRRAMSLIGDKP